MNHPTVGMQWQFDIKDELDIKTTLQIARTCVKGLIKDGRIMSAGAMEGLVQKTEQLQQSVNMLEADLVRFFRLSHPIDVMSVNDKSEWDALYDRVEDLAQLRADPLGSTPE